MAIPRCSTGFSTCMSCDIYRIQKTVQATEDKEVDVLDRGCKNCMSACAGVGVRGSRNGTQCLSTVFGKRRND